MEKTRVPKREKYWFIDYDMVVLSMTDDYLTFCNNTFKCGNYFATREEAEVCARKLRAVLKGADVIEVPSEEEISRESDYSAHKMDIDDGETPNSGLYWHGRGDAIRWLKSKIVK